MDNKKISKKNIKSSDKLLSRYERGLYLLFFILLIILITKFYYLNNSFDIAARYDFSSLDSLHQADLIKEHNQQLKIVKNKSIKRKYKVKKKKDLKDSAKVKKTGEINKINSLTVSEKIININTSNIEELVTVKGIGKVTAERIILLREKKGKFKVLDELLEVKGIGKKKLEKFRKYIEVK